MVYSYYNQGFSSAVKCPYPEAPACPSTMTFAGSYNTSEPSATLVYAISISISLLFSRSPSISASSRNIYAHSTGTKLEANLTPTSPSCAPL